MKRCKSMMDKDDTMYKLHDDLLHRIIDLLPIKDALRTCVLSSRWRNLWRSISNIDLEQFSFTSKDDVSHFLDSIDKLLVYHDSSDIERFVSCKGRINGARIHRWISEVIKRNVQELRLGCGFLEKTCILPLCLFKSESLTVLEIDIYSVFLGSDPSLFTVHLPSLRRLKLSRTVFLNNTSIQQFFSNIPKLQQLCLHDCNWEKVDRLIINIPTLEEVDVFARDFYMDFLLSNHSSSLNVFLDAVFFPDGDDRIAVIRLLESVKNLMSLKLTWYFSKWLTLNKIAARDLPLFIYLKHLEISSNFNSYGEVNLKKILMFLHNMPNLRSLAITLPEERNHDWEIFGWHFEEDWSNSDVPYCVIHQIKKFSISSHTDIFGGGGRPDVNSVFMGLINYFMNHSRSLEMLEVHWLCYYSRPTQEVLDDIERHPRYSELKNLSCSSTIIPMPDCPYWD